MSEQKSDEIGGVTTDDHRDRGPNRFVQLKADHSPTALRVGRKKNAIAATTAASRHVAAKTSASDASMVKRCCERRAGKVGWAGNEADGGGRISKHTGRTRGQQMLKVD